MTLPTNPRSFCMSLRAVRKSPRGERKDKTEGRFLRRKSTSPTIPENQITELLFENCIDCERMSAVPQGVFAVRKIRQNQEQNWSIPKMYAKEGGNENKGNYNAYSNNKPVNQSTELTPLKYNSKLMNSIWGLYNRYSVHNFKKNTDSKDGGLVAGWRASFAPLAPQNPATAASDNPRVLMP